MRFAAVDVHDVQAAIADVGGAPTRRVDTRIDDGSRCREWPRGAGLREVHGVGRAGEREDRHAAVVIERVLGDARADLAEALAARALLVGK